MTPIILFLICTVLLVGVSVWLWRYWDRATQMTPEEEAFDRRVARLNENQANRVSDEELSQVVDDDSAWQIMVERGRKASRRRDRYTGALERRTRERKK